MELWVCSLLTWSHPKPVSSALGQYVVLLLPDGDTQALCTVANRIVQNLKPMAGCGGTYLY